MNLFRKKSIERIKSDAEQGFIDAEASGTGLRRSLGVTDLTLMGIAAIIGASIFAMVGKASYEGGPGIVFLFVFTAIACLFSALCYAEFASRIPVAGSAYTYSYASLGELVAWIIGWDLIVEYAIGNIAVAISWSDYFTNMLKGWGIDIPLHFTMDYLTASRGFTAVTEALGKGGTIEALTKVCETSKAINCGQLEAYTAFSNAPKIGSLPIVCDLPALLITLSITALVFIGIRESKWAGTAMTVLKIGVILMVIFLGAFYVQPANWSPFLPNGFSGVMKGVAAVFFAYIGFDALSTTAEECKNPTRDLPRAMIYSLIICTILYCSLALVLTGMVSYEKFKDVGDPLAFVFGATGANLPWVAMVISISAVIALATVFLVFQIGQPRLWMAMSRDGLLPKIFSGIHPTFRTPWFATIITGLVVAIPALFMNLSEVTELSSIGTLFAFLIVCAGVLFKDKEFGRENRFVPYINSEWIIPILAVAGMGLFFYFNNTSVFWDFFSLGNSAPNESWFDSFSHKIPLLSFLILTCVLVFLGSFKKLSLIPVLGVLSCAYLMTQLDWTNWYRFGIWLLLGIRIYRFFGYRNSNLNDEKVMPKGINLLKIASVAADLVLISLFIIPLIGYFSSLSLDNIWLRLGVGLVIAVVLEVLTQKREKSV
jgi:basic amino acid/polyamine antiporter, APA family